MMTKIEKFCLHEPATGRQANNVVLVPLSSVVRPWFKDISSEKVEAALTALDNESTREAALSFLGLELTAAA